MQSVNGFPTWPLPELYFVSGKCCLPESLSRFYECDIVRIDILRGKIDMGPISRPAEIGILIYPEAQLAAVHGLTDIFLVANRFAAVRRLPAEPALRVSHWRQIANGKAVECVFDTIPGPYNRPAVLIAPPSLSKPISRELAAPFAAWLTEWHDDGSVLCSVCAGAFVLAETGLLAGRSATTHWTYLDELTRRFPDIRVDGDKLIIQDGDIITAGGVMAWTDLGMKLVDRLLGSTRRKRDAWRIGRPPSSCVKFLTPGPALGMIAFGLEASLGPREPTR
jgi:transcriptional regulator GlxA family with amidase domain